MPRPPQETHAYLVGGGIASLTAAVHLYHDAGVPASHIHIIEAGAASGGAMGRGPGQDEDRWERGYVILAARKLNFSYRCLYDTLAKVPSSRGGGGRTVLDDVRGVPLADDGDGAEAENGQPVGVAEADPEADPGRVPAAGREAEARREVVAAGTPAASTPGHARAETPPAAAPSPAAPSTHTSTLPARLVAATPAGPQIVDVQSLGLQPDERMGLLGLILESEHRIGDGEIQAHFRPAFFESKFWDVWASLYGFQPWHSAVEFRRYLVRFLHEFARIGTLAGIDHAPLNDYECIIRPVEAHLQRLGVDFQYDTLVTDVCFAPGAALHVDALRLRRRAAAADSTLALGPHDFVLLTLGSLTAGVRLGSNTTAPPPLPSQEAVLADPSPVWRFWAGLADPARNPHWAAFGRPQVFYGQIAKSSWLSFTITLAGAATSVFHDLKAWAGFRDIAADAASHPAPHPGPGASGSAGQPVNSSGGVPLITLRDSPWMMSITLPHQPYFSGQPADVCVLWGYGLYPDQEGMFVRKPMLACSGADIFAELLAYLHIPPPSAGTVTTIPCLMPFIGTPFLPRTDGDRPAVLPAGSDNLALLGQFVEMDRDVTFTTEYSARSAQTAVYSLMGMDKVPPPVHRGDRDVQVLGEMLLTIMS